MGVTRLVRVVQSSCCVPGGGQLSGMSAAGDECEISDEWFSHETIL